MKILLLDIETAPNTAYVWGLFKQNIPIQAIVGSGYVLCWAAKWLGSEEVYYESVRDGDDTIMLEGIHALLSDADAVIHYNGARFDIPTLNKEFVQKGMLPPSAYQQIDLLRTVRKEFRFPSNKLDYVAKALGVRQKVRHSGFQMWVDCMNGEEEAWDMMQEYNIGDIEVLEDVYLKILPWIKNHPNIGLHNNEPDTCPNCGGHHLEKRGHSYTNAGKYQRYQCKDCGTWSRSKKTLAVKGLLQQDKN